MLTLVLINYFPTVSTVFVHSHLYRNFLTKMPTVVCFNPDPFTTVEFGQEEATF